MAWWLGTSPAPASTNDGTITVPGSETSGMVVYNSTDSHLVNNGTINMVGAGGVPPTLSTGMLAHDQSHNSVVENNGTINVFAAMEGIKVIDSVGVVAYNRGVVQASGPDAIGYRTDVASTLINSGTIFMGSPAARAIVFAAPEAADTLTLQAGTRLQGTIDMGGGADLVTLDRTGDTVGWRFTLENFDEASGELMVTERSGGNTIVTIANVTPHHGTGPKLSLLAGTVGQGVLDQLTLRDNDTGATVWSGAFDANLDGSRFGGVAFGADAATPDGAARLGVFAGLGQSSATGAGFGYETSEVYGGLYGRLMGDDGYFADLVMLGGQGQGTAETRQVANNLVPGGLETVESGDNSGSYAAIRGRVGATIPVTFGTLVPSLTIGYAQENRQGYVEAGAVGMAVDDHTARVLDGRLAIAALTSPDVMSDRLHLGATGGLDIATDLSNPVTFDMAGSSFSLPESTGTSRGNWFIGATGSLELEKVLRFETSVELLINAWNSGNGLRANIGLVGTF